MKIADYPPQEPASPLGAAYGERALAAGSGIEGVEHAYGSDPYQRVAVHRPAAPNGDVLLFWHGGGWTHGYKEWMSFMAPVLNALGVTFVSAGYRLAPGHLFPAGLDDAAAAVAWTHAHIGAHGGDPKRLFIGGHSAGGHYASLLATASAWRRRHGLPADVVRGCLPVSGVFRLGEQSGLTIRPRFLGPAPAPGDDDAVARSASPLGLIEPAVTPPFLIAHGSRDFPHLVAQAAQMADALRAAGIDVETMLLTGCDHFDASLACGDERSGWPARAAVWMRAR